ncbi:hypothetical protein MMC07_000658 [Pseudocyphellaria aurata]|nr:hypothetical protein [Pseudocyphellaria aurata]
MLPQLATVILYSLSLVLAAPQTRNGVPESEGETTIDGVPIADIPKLSDSQAARPFALVANDRAGWTVTADSSQPGNGPENVLDGNANSIWHTRYNPDAPQPHYITIDMKSARYVNGLSYQPRQDGSPNGNIGQHKIYCSTDPNNFGAELVYGTYRNDGQTKTSVFPATNCRYVKLTTQSEVNGKAWANAAEINILSAPGPPPSGAGVGKWGPTVDIPLVPVSVAMTHDSGKLVFWSSYRDDRFTDGNGGLTVTATFDPGSHIVSQRTITNTQHDMFCEGLSTGFDGRWLATGGNDNAKATFYDPPADNWISAPNMRQGRGYQAQTTLSDGRTFVIGGSWSGGQGNKNGEIYSPASNTWTSLPGCPVAPMLTADGGGVYRADNHGWLFAWKGGSVFQAGPSKQINWYGTGGGGSQKAAGTRAADGDSMNGNAVMYDALAGKILTVGGAPNYVGGTATFNAHIITIGAPNTNPTVQRINDMYFQRAFHNSVVLHDGTVFICGGQVNPQPFSDDTAILTPEIWNPNGFHFVKAAPQPIPRTYHSVVIMMLDGTVFSGGGGLCGDCATNHFDGQFYYPPYFYTASGALAARPTINSVSTYTVKLGGSINVSGNGCTNTWSLIRYSSNTHTVNTDQRRFVLTANGGTLTIPTDPGVALPGYYMISCLNTANVPSTSRTLKITP